MSDDYWTFSAIAYQEVLDYLQASTEDTPLAKIDKAYHKFTFDINSLKNKAETNLKAAGKYGALAHFLHSVAVLKFKPIISQEDLDLLIKRLEYQLARSKDLAK